MTTPINARHFLAPSLVALALSVGCGASGGDTAAGTTEVATGTGSTTQVVAETTSTGSTGPETPASTSSSSAAGSETSDGSSSSGSPGGIETCDDMAAWFVNSPATNETVSCELEDGTDATCCRLTFSAGLMEDGPYCPPSRTSPPPYGLSVYDGATNPGLRAFDGTYLDDIAADGYSPMADANGDTNINTGGGPPEAGASHCLAMDQDPDLTIESNIPLVPKMADSPGALREVENLGVSIMGVPGTADPPSATMGPQMGGPGGGDDSGDINVPSIGSCGAHPEPAGYLHDHFVPQVMSSVLSANGIAASDVECTRYEQDPTALYGFAKDGYPIFASRDEASEVPGDLDECGGHTHATPLAPGGGYHYHASETQAPNFMECLRGVPVERSFQYD